MRGRLPPSQKRIFIQNFIFRITILQDPKPIIRIHFSKYSVIVQNRLRVVTLIWKNRKFSRMETITLNCLKSK